MKTHIMTEGREWKHIFRFALPLLGISFIQQLYNTVDLIFVGNLLGKNEVAAVGASSLFVTCLIGLFSGVSLGAGVLSGIAFGKKDLKGLKALIHTAIFIAILFGFAIMVLGIGLAPIFLKLIKTPLEAQSLAVSYMKIYFLSAVSMLVYNMSSVILRSLGNARAPLLYQLMGGILNIVLNAIFLVSLKLGVAGVAFSTLISQTMTAILALHHLSRLDPAYGFSLNHLRLQGGYFQSILRIGLPAGVQALAITLSNVFVQFQVNQLGINELAAFTAYFKIELLIYLPILAIGQSVSTFTSQNLGANKIDRLRKGTASGIFIGLPVTLLMIGLVYAFRGQLVGLFVKDPDAIILGSRIIAVTVPFYWLYLLLEVLGATIRGAGKTMASMMIILINICLVRTALLQILMSQSKAIESIAAVYPITWALTGLLMGVYYYNINWNIYKEVA